MLGVPSNQIRLPDGAAGLLVGIALGEHLGSRGAPGGLPLTEEALAVAEVLLDRGEVDRGELMWRWLTLPAPAPTSATPESSPGRLGRPRLPLARCLPIAVAAAGSGGAAREWAEAAATTTHPGAEARLTAIGATLLARDLLTRSLGDSLVRLGQALREDAPENLLRSLVPGEPGEAVSEGESEAEVLRAAIHCLSYAESFEAALDEATSRGLAGDQLPALVGGLAGARFGRSGLPRPVVAALPPGLAARLEEMAERLLERRPRLVQAVPQRFVLDPAS